MNSANPTSARKWTRQRKQRAGLLLLLFVAVLWFFEGPGSRPPGWWRNPKFWPLASGPVRWRVVAPVMKLTGNLPELGWGELRGYVFHWADDEASGGFVRRVRDDGEASCPTLWSTPFGDLWGRSTDGELLEFLVVEQLIERIYDNRHLRIEPGDVIVDVGAHLGVYTAFALAKGAGQVVAIEPEPVNLACFKQTFDEEITHGRVRLVEVAAWDSRDVLVFDVPGEGNTGGGRIDGGEGESHVLFSGTIEVPAVPIDDVVAELGLERVDIIKMDIEGAERQALTGARRTLARFGPQLALCTYHNADDYDVLTAIALEARPQYRIKTGHNHMYLR